MPDSINIFLKIDIEFTTKIWRNSIFVFCFFVEIVETEENPSSEDEEEVDFLRGPWSR